MAKWTAPYLGGARHDENGKYARGQAGDQTTKEVNFSKWYALPAGWKYVIRAKDRKKRALIGDNMLKVCNNKNYGYDQVNRGTAYTAAKKVGFKLDKVNKPCECDCSSSTSLVMIASGYDKIPYNCTTSTLIQAIQKNYPDDFEIFTDKAHVASDKLCRKGDIYLAPGHHVEVVVKGGVPYVPTGRVK